MMKFALLSLCLFLGIIACSSPGNNDHSLNEDDYTKLGVPDHNRSWDGKDYTTACNTLFKLKYQNPLSLPVKNSTRSGRVFDRIVSLNNLSFLDIDSLPLYKKAYLISTFVNIQSTLLDIYYDGARTKQFYSTELVHIYIFGLQIVEKMMELAKKINDSSDINDKTMKYEYDTIRLSYMKMLQYLLDRLKHQSLYKSDDFATLSDSVRFSIKRNLMLFDSVSTYHIKPGLQAVADSSSSERIKFQYLILIDSIDNFSKYE